MDVKKIVLESSKYIVTHSEHIFKPTHIIDVDMCTDFSDYLSYLTGDEPAYKYFSLNNIPYDYQYIIFRKNIFNTCSEIFTNKTYHFYKFSPSSKKDKDIVARTVDKERNERSSFVTKYKYWLYEDVYYFLIQLEELGLYENYVKGVMEFYNVKNYNLENVTKNIISDNKILVRK